MTPPTPQRTDYGPPVGVAYEAWVPGFGKVTATSYAGCQKLIDRILRGDWPGGV